MKVGPSLDYGRYRDYQSLTQVLRELEKAHPHLVELTTIGHSFEGRDIWAVTLTDRRHGQHDLKPALYVDCNIHAGEVTTSALALYTIGTLAQNYARDPVSRAILESFAIYIIPRIAVDGSEVYLKTPHIIRSSKRTLHDAVPDHGIVPCDINADGEVTLMRVPHLHGEWKVSPKDPRVMIRRLPGELVGHFYRVYPEGRIERESPIEPVKVRKHPQWPLDFNRQFPCNWSPKHKGAGPYPLSEPETRAQAEFIMAHPNIACMLAFHTAEGVILKPAPDPGTPGFHEDDLHILNVLAGFGSKYTGYPALPTADWAQGHQSHGTFPDWAYTHMGAIAFLVEMWDIAAAAGFEIPRAERGRFYESIPEDAEIRMLQWLDGECSGKGFVPWKSFEHPDLGLVEIGGWCLKFTRQNPPERYLLQELEKNYPFILEMAGSLPKVVVENIHVTELGPDAVLVQAAIANAGYLPTYVTRQALVMERDKGVTARLEVEGGYVASGTIEQAVGHLEGRSAHGDNLGRRGYNIYGNPQPDSQRIISWSVKFTSSSPQIAVVAGTPRAGWDRVPVVVPSHS